MSTFLELVQRLHRECGASGSAPSSVLNQVGQNLRLVGWVAEADYNIQLLHTDWKFLWRQSTGLTTTASVSTLAKPVDLHYWDFDTFKLDGEKIEAVEYHDIKDEVLDDSEAYPSRIIVMPDNSLMFEPVPDDSYSVTADYFKKPVKLAANNDESLIPAEFELCTIGRALILYANYEGAPEAKIQGSEWYTEHLARLENSQLPNKKHARFKQGGHFEVRAE